MCSNFVQKLSKVSRTIFLCLATNHDTNTKNLILTHITLPEFTAIALMNSYSCFEGENRSTETFWYNYNFYLQEVWIFCKESRFEIQKIHLSIRVARLRRRRSRRRRYREWNPDPDMQQAKLRKWGWGREKQTRFASKT